MLLGIAEIPDPRAQGQSEHPRMSLHADGRDGRADRAGVAGDARNFSVEAGLPNLQRLRHVAVQEARTGFAIDGRDKVETRDASDPFVDVWRDCVESRTRAGERGGTSQPAAGDLT